MTSLETAVQVYIDRKLGTSPVGATDKQGRWYPSDAEWQSCCSLIRSPSAVWQWSLYKHCHTLPHIATMYGVDESELRKAVNRRAVRPSTRVRAGIFYKAVALHEGVMLSIYDGSTEYRIGHTLEQLAVRGHRGGYYVYASLKAALSAEVPLSSVLYDAPRVLLEVETSGRAITYRCTCLNCKYGDSQHPAKYAFSRVTPLRVVPYEEVDGDVSVASAGR